MPPLSTVKKGTATLFKKSVVVVEDFNMVVCHDGTAHRAAPRRPASMVNFFPLKLFLWKGKEGSGVLLIKQHLKIVGGEGLLFQLPFGNFFFFPYLTTELEFQVTGACDWSALYINEA